MRKKSYFCNIINENLPTMNKPDTIPLFLSFCIEQYKHAHSLGGRQAMEKLAASGTLDYLATCYESIHTQSPEWIMEEIEDYMSKHDCQ